MPYPISPFTENNFLPEDITSDDLVIYFQDLLRWLCIPPKLTSYRVNTLKYSVDEVFKLIVEKVNQFSEKRGIEAPLVIQHQLFKDVILFHNFDTKHLNLQRNNNEVVVDVVCAAAILRGAHIYAPGIMGMISGTSVNSKVSIYADISGKCKRGFLKKYECNQKIFIGNGIVKMRRHELFGENIKPRGIAVEVTDTISGCPNMHDFLPDAAAILQNIPSIACVYALDPQEGETILDMCAAPGNKTTHIAAVMKNNGTLIAIDKTASKVKVLEENRNRFAANFEIIQADSTQLLSDNIFLRESFDKILLDAPCSALGQRPQLVNNTSEKVLRSYAPLQKKLFSNAVDLLKTNGRLVYSTCTITLAENEKMVAWALKTFPDIALIKPEPFIGGIGLPCCNLTEQQQTYLQRFGQEQDFIGFFVAVFVKK